MPITSQSFGQSDESFPWPLGVYDAHCHPTDTTASLESIPAMQARALTVMATRAQDQQVVDKLAQDQGLAPAAPAKDIPTREAQGSVVPAFGWHPWFSHQLFDDSERPCTDTDAEEAKRKHYNKVLRPTPVDEDFLRQLPDPVPLSYHLIKTRARLQSHPLAMVGEIGLDRSFRLPKAWTPDQLRERDKGLTPGGRERRGLSPYRVEMSHQTAVLLAQLRLAAELRRSVSVHGVRCSGVLYDTLAQTWEGHERKILSKAERKRRLNGPGTDMQDDEQPLLSKPSTSGSSPPRVCLHSYSGDAGFLKQYFNPSVPTDIYASFSMVINFGPQGTEWSTQAIKAIPDDRLLIESDLHTAGREMDDSLEWIARRVCQIKGWDLQRGVQQLADNWQAFVFGTRARG